ncbi:MAG: glycosyltransferase family 4 protein [Halothiobacillaceae bacterium]
MKQLRIAMITRNFATHGGGAERYAVAIAEQLATRHELHVFAQAIEHDDARITYHRLPAMRKPRWLNQWLFARRVARLTATGFDIVHSHENGAAGQVQTVHVRPMRHNLLPADSGLARRLAQWLKIVTSLRLMVYLRLEAARFKPCPGRVIGVVSSTLRDEMAASYPTSRACLQIIAPGVVVPTHPPEKNAARAMLGVPQDGLMLLFVANDYRRKGLDTLLDAISIVARMEAEGWESGKRTPVDERGAVAPGLRCASSGLQPLAPSPLAGEGWGEGGIRLIVVGNPAQAQEYQAHCRSLGLAEQVHFLGSQSDMQPVYAAADMLVHPTREDSFGMVVLEAMAQGVPVIVSRAPFCGLSAELAADEALLLQDPYSAEELAAALQSLLDDAPRRAELAATGRIVAARYDWAKQAQRYEQLYFQLLARPS